MKLNQILSRLRPRRATRTPSMDMTSNWSTRDWADLPAHHPRND